MSNEARNAEIARLRSDGLSFSQIAERLGVTRNIVAGALWRKAQPSRPRAGHRPFRNEELVRRAVVLASEKGLSAAAREVHVDIAILCRWRRRLELIDGCSYGYNGPRSSPLNDHLADIAAKRAGGAKLREIAAEYGVSIPAVFNALRRANERAA